MIAPRPPRCRGALSVLFAAAAFAAGHAPPPPGSRGADGASARAAYYLVVYAAQERTYNPETSHCFATFARVVAPGGEAPPRVVLRHINWFSVRGHKTGLTHGVVESDGRPARPEPGENRTTREALLLAQRRGLRVSRWGPYEIDRGLYERALRQIDLLEGRVPGRRVLYKALDLGYRDGKETLALNCIHAVSDVAREPAPLRTWTSYGDEAARRVVAHLGRWVKGSGREHPEVWGAIWGATWGGVPVPPLDLARGAPPWGDRDEAVAQGGEAGDPAAAPGGG